MPVTVCRNCMQHVYKNAKIAAQAKARADRLSARAKKNSAKACPSGGCQPKNGKKVNAKRTSASKTKPCNCKN